VPVPRPAPVLVFDGDCRFCSSAARFVLRRVRPDADVVAFQAADLAALGVTEERARRELLWVRPDGGVDGGAQAVASLLIAGGRGWRPLGLLGRTRPFGRLAAWGYRVVAANRARLPGGSAACATGAPTTSGG